MVRKFKHSVGEKTADGGVIISLLINNVHYDYEVQYDGSTIRRFKEEEMNVLSNDNKLTNKESDLVNQPNHYTHGGIETLAYMKAKMKKEAFEGFLAGNVIKYISRYEHKNGVEDLKKAKVYLEKLIKEKEITN